MIIGVVVSPAGEISNVLLVKGIDDKLDSSVLAAKGCLSGHQLYMESRVRII